MTKKTLTMSADGTEEQVQEQEELPKVFIGKVCLG